MMLEANLRNRVSGSKVMMFQGCRDTIFWAVQTTFPFWMALADPVSVSAKNWRRYPEARNSRPPCGTSTSYRSIYRGPEIMNRLPLIRNREFPAVRRFVPPRNAAIAGQSFGRRDDALSYQGLPR